MDLGSWALSLLVRNEPKAGLSERVILGPGVSISVNSLPSWLAFLGLLINGPFIFIVASFLAPFLATLHKKVSYILLGPMHLLDRCP